MNLSHPPIPVSGTKAGGPGKYLVRAKDARGKTREPAPQLLFGTPVEFDQLVRCSKSRHPHLHGALSYRSEPNPPSRATKNTIVDLYLRMMRGGIAEDHICTLGVDHSDHDHVTIYRHLVAPNWPRFQPYYHKNDWLLISDFQWLVNHRHGFAAPENPANGQLLSLAGKRFDTQNEQLLAELREDIKGLSATNSLRLPGAFIRFLRKTKCYKVELKTVENVDADAGGEVDNNRIWLKVTRTDGLETLLQGPICSPRFIKSEYDAKHAEKARRYYEFVENPMPLWTRFIEGNAKRHELNRARFSKFMDMDPSTTFLGFDVLHPENYQQTVTSVPVEIS